MNNKPYFRLVALLLVCQLVLAACMPTEQAKTDNSSTTAPTASSELHDVTTTVTSLHSTTVTLAPTTGKPATTVTKTKPTVTTTTGDINVLPSGTKAQGERHKMLGTPAFSYESEDYDVLRKLILQKFPGEKNLDEFRVTKTKKKGRVFDGTEFVQYTHSVDFVRWINGCSTDSFYAFYFDENDKGIVVWVKQEDYNLAKVIPPRVATEAEIEAAKQEEAKKVREGFVIWKQEVSPSIYDIERDANYFKITTQYVSKSTYDAYSDETSSYYGRTPPHSAYFGSYVIPR